MELTELRKQIDQADQALLSAFVRRMQVSAQIAACKQEQNLPVLDRSREEQKLESVRGQVPADLRDEAAALYETLFRLSRDYQTRLQQKPLRCGLLGQRLGHSYSPKLHGLFGGYAYRLYEVEPGELDGFLRAGDFDGLNVTIPYKKAVLPYCAELSETAKRIGSVNTLVRRPDGTLYGDNTDAFGFSLLLDSGGVDPKGKKALVFGSGGASVTACHVLESRGAEVVVISRSGENNYTNLHRHFDAEILVNATPLGMYPNNGVSPVELSLFPHCALVLDLVYNPARTALLLQAEALGIPHAGGLLMLAAQAAKSSQLFTDVCVSDAQISRAVQTLSREMQNLVLIGMPGCGKTTVGQLLAQKLRRPFADSDAEVERLAGKSIPAIFREYGEDAFRSMESKVLADLGKRSGIVIATGGGSVLRQENYAALHQNGLILRLQRDLALLSTDGRPLSQRSDLHELLRQREPLYARFADRTIDNNGSLSETLNRLMEGLTWSF